jgi:TPR repeat protein
MRLGGGGWLAVTMVCAAAGSALGDPPGVEAGTRAQKARSGDATTLAVFRARARGGDTAAQVLLGRMYETGKGARRDASMAFEWYWAAAEQGDAEGQLLVGTMLLSGGGGGPCDATRALRWLRLSAEQGTRDAQLLLGLAYSGAFQSPRDPVQSDFWLRRAAEHGERSASVPLAVLEQQMTTEQLTAARQLLAMRRSPRKP